MLSNQKTKLQVKMINQHIIRKVKEKHIEEWRQLPGFVSAGIGIIHDEEAGIILQVTHITQDIREKVPGRIDDVLVKLQEAAPFRAL
jgi:hypothetical protein